MHDHESIIPAIALRNALSRVTVHIINDHLRSLVKGISNSYPETTREAMLEKVIQFRPGNSALIGHSTTEQQARAEVRDIAKRQSRHKVDSMFWVLKGHGVILTPDERASLEGAAIEGATQTRAAPRTPQGRLNSVLENIGDAEQESSFSGDDLDRFEVAAMLPAAKDPKDHPYVSGKFETYNARATSHMIYVPIFNLNLETVGCQKIDQSGKKRNSQGIKLPGHFGYTGEIIDGKFPETALAAEGWKDACFLLKQRGCLASLRLGAAT